MAWKRPPSIMAKSLQRRKKRVERALGDGLQEAVKEAKREVERRIYLPDRVNKQDAPGGREISLTNRSPVRTKIRTKERRATIRVASHWTRARTRAVVNLFRKYGLASQLERKALWVRLTPNFEVRESFRANPDLHEWAADRGQDTRHAVRLRDARIGRDLILGPGVASARPRIFIIWRNSLRKAGFSR